MEDNSDAGSVTRSIRRLTQFVVAVTALLGAVLAFTADWGAVKSALFGGQTAHGATTTKEPIAPSPSRATLPPVVTPASEVTSPARFVSQDCAVDPKAAWNDSNNCYIAYQRGRTSEAEALCNRGLAEAKCTNRPDIEGMLYFSLGLCAETRADWRSSKRLYESSLQVRPGNAKVQERLDAVTARLEVAGN